MFVILKSKFYKTTMGKQEICNIVFAIIYLILLIYLIPKSGTTYDLLKIRLNLFPYWVKFISIVCFAISFGVAFYLHGRIDYWNYIFILNINFSLFLMLFSKVKDEDELTEFLRFRAITYAFITFLVITGIYGFLSVGRSMKMYGLNYLYIQGFTGLSLFIAVVYFHFTKYKSLKE